MNRAELERLDRGALIERAEAAGVTRARILTRPELVDELLLRGTPDEATRARVRGFFGLARDLLASVVERGLHLPDAADRIRTMGPPPPPRRGAPAALPTVTLAEIYAAQGHRDRAIETLEGVLSREPEHAVARTLLGQLEDASFPVPPPRLPPELEDAAAAWAGEGDGMQPESAAGAPSSPALPATTARTGDLPSPEPALALADATLPPRHDVDECVAIPVDPRTLYVYWEIRERTLEHVRARHPEGLVALRFVVLVPTWDGPRSSAHDHAVRGTIGDFFAQDLPLGCVVRAAIGWKDGDLFLPVAHSPALETWPGAPSPLVADVLLRWTADGPQAVGGSDRDAAAISRALGRARQGASRAREAGDGVIEGVAYDALQRRGDRPANAPTSPS